MRAESNVCSFAPAAVHEALRSSRLTRCRPTIKCRTGSHLRSVVPESRQPRIRCRLPVGHYTGRGLLLNVGYDNAAGQAESVQLSAVFRSGQDGLSHNTRGAPGRGRASGGSRSRMMPRTPRSGSIGRTRSTIATTAASASSGHLPSVESGWRRRSAGQRRKREVDAAGDLSPLGTAGTTSFSRRPSMG